MVNDDDELMVVLSVVDDSHPSDLNLPLERPMEGGGWGTKCGCGGRKDGWEGEEDKG